jgi:hypothetical protein
MHVLLKKKKKKLKNGLKICNDYLKLPRKLVHFYDVFALTSKNLSSGQPR